MSRLNIVVVGLIAAAAVAVPSRSDAQLTCTANLVANCTLGGAASAGMTITIPTVARVTVASSTVALPAPTEASYNTGFGSPGSVSFEVRANAAWTVVISSASALWSFSPPSARNNKPRADLQWSLNSGGPYTDISASLVTFASGAATNSSIQTLYLRSKYNWTLDLPGSYSLPVSIVLTAP